MPKVKMHPKQYTVGVPPPGQEEPPAPSVLALVEQWRKKRNAPDDEFEEWCDYDMEIEAAKRAFEIAADQLEAALKAAPPVEQERQEAYEYLARLFKHYAPECKPLPSLTGLCTQIDTLLVHLAASPSVVSEPPRKESQ
jgi:hypothetical protein